MAWRTRVWVLTMVPVVVSMATPWILLAVFAGRLPDRAYVDGWSRVGPDSAHLAPTWTEWASRYLFVAAVACFAAIALVYWRRVPRLQRWTVAVTWAFLAQIAAGLIIHVSAVVDVPGFSVPPSPWWSEIATVLIGMVAAVAAWGLAGRLPSRPDARGALPPWALRRNLGPTERVVFFEAIRSVQGVVLGCVFLAIAVALSSAGLVLVGGAVLLMARARVQIDGEGVQLELPLLRIRQRVSYREIRYAEVVDRSYIKGYSLLLEDTHRFGYVGQRSDYMVVRVSDNREFVVSLRAAPAAVALVNGEIARRRELAC